MGARTGRLRVVAGALSGRRFALRIASATRPTADRVREAIASAVDVRGGFPGTQVLDLFAGTGAMAIEALSRGAAGAVLVESDRDAARGIEESLRALELTSRAELVQVDLAQPARLIARLRGHRPFHRVFADPPYADTALLTPLLAALGDEGMLEDGALVVLEHPRASVPTLPPGYTAMTQKRYGDAAVLFASYARAPSESET